MKTTVPIDIRRQFEDALGREDEVWSLCSSRNRAGDPGETWIVATRTRLIVGDRGFGGPVSLREIPLDTITGIETEGGSFGAGRAVILGKSGAIDGICFSSLERDDFSSLGNRIQAKKTGATGGEAKVLGEEKQTARRRKAPPAETIPMAIELAEAPVARPSARPPLPPRTGRVPASGAFDLFIDQPYATPGRQLTGVLRLTWPKDRVVRGVRMFWTGLERTHVTTGSGKSSHTHISTHDWMRQRIGLFGVPDPLGFFGSMSDALSAKQAYPVLKAGTYEFPFEVRVPPGAPATYAGMHVDVTWDLHAQVDIPRAFDLSDRYPIRIIPTPPAQLRSREGKHERSVFLRAWIDGGPAAPGAPITGGFFIGNPSGKTIRAATVSVQRTEQATAGGHTRLSSTAESTIRFPGAGISDTDVPFKLALPKSWCPWSGRFSRLGYQVKVALDVAWALDVEVVLDLTP